MNSEGSFETSETSFSQSVSQSVLVSSPTWNSWPDVYMLSDHYGFSRFAASSLTRGRVCLLLVVLSLSGVSLHKIKLFIICIICICNI